jgi:site-specific recombinase
VLLGLIWWKLTGRPPLDPATAAHSLQGLHPLRSWTLPFAALTGVFLWMSSLAAGWAANWSAFRCLPQALAGHRRLIYWLGPDGAATAGRVVERHLGGVCGTIALGFLLGFMPMVFAFAGLPVEVRHVTLSAASLALCVAHGLATPGTRPCAPPSTPGMWTARAGKVYAECCGGPSGITPGISSGPQQKPKQPLWFIQINKSYVFDYQER